MVDEFSRSIITQYGLAVFLLGWFFYREMWPLIRDWLKPSAAAARRREQAAQAKAELELFTRVLTAFESNTTVQAGLQATMSQAVVELRALSSSVHELNEDVAGLYGFIQKPRPSRRPTTKEKEQETSTS